MKLQVGDYPPLADWRDGAQYPSDRSYSPTENLVDDPYFTSKLWAWQFLRRNCEYRAAFRSIRGSQASAQIERAHEFGLHFLVPDHVEHPILVPFIDSLALRVQQPRLNPSHGPLKLEQVAIRFDISRPIAPQLQLARSALLEQRRLLSRNQTLTDTRKHLAEYPTYLRILDAVQAGVSNREIAKHFIEERTYQRRPHRAYRWYEGEAKLERDLRTARMLAATGYRSVAFT